MDKNQLIDLSDLAFSACSIWNDAMFFFTEKDNMLLKMDLCNYKAELRIYDDSISKATGENTAFLLNDKDSIYRLQLNGKKLVEYELKLNRTFVYNINESKGMWGNFSYMTIYDGCLYLFPGCVEKIIIIDLERRGVRHKINVSEMIKHQEFSEEKDYYWRKGCRIDNELVMLYSYNKSEIFIYDLTSNHYETITLSAKIKGVIDICQAEKEVYILDDQNNLYGWEYPENKLKLMVKIAEAYEKNDLGKIINTDTKIILLPCLGEDIYVLDKRNKQYSIYQDYPDDFEYIGDKGWAKYINECQLGNSVYFPMRRSHYILKIDRKAGDLEWIKPVPPLKTDRVHYYIKKGIKYFNEGTINLDEYIDIIANTTIN